MVLSSSDFFSSWLEYVRSRWQVCCYVQDASARSGFEDGKTLEKNLGEAS